MAGNDPTQRFYPKPGKTAQKHGSPMPPHAHSALPPMPALEELVPPAPGRDDLTRQPTIPLRLPPDDLTRQPTIPLPRVKAHAKEASLEKRRASSKIVYKDPGVVPPRLKRLKKRRGPRRTSLILVALLLVLIALGGAIASGLYMIQTDVLGPLGQFFRPLSGDDNGSIDGRAWNLLLLGSDNDEKFVFPELLTQVMMVVHVDPLNNSVFMVSIPRDSWVSVPGQAGMHKIDQAFYLGSAAHRDFDDGVRLAQATIEQDYGIPIDRYAWIGLGGFASVINTLGGIDIDVTHPILDDNYPNDTGRGSHASNPYAVERLYLPPGPQHLNGSQALEYVRSRHADLVGDIGRTQRQQQVLAALKKKLNVSTIFNHLSGLFRDLAGKVYTDLSENELLSTADFTRGLPADAIQQLTLGPGQGSQDYGSIGQVNDPSLDGSQDVIVPNCATIQPVINQIFGLGDIQSCQVGGPG